MNDIHKLINKIESVCLPILRKVGIVRSFEQIVKDEVLKLKDNNDNKIFKIFLSLDEIKDWGNKYYGSWAQDIIDEHEDFEEREFMNRSSFGETEHSAIECYAGYLYQEINMIMRKIHIKYKSDDFITTIRKIAKKMDNALSRTTVVQGIIAFRWIDYDGFSNLFKSDTVTVIEGNTMKEDGFMSTSLRYDYIPDHFHREGLDEIVLLIIRVPKDTKGAYIDHISKRSNESEFLLARGQNLKIIKKIYCKGKNAIFLCDLLI